MVTWEIEYTDQFEKWWNELTADQQERITAAVRLLAQHGPGLGRPAVDTITTSRHPDMKELISGTTRTLFAFDPRRTAILLLAGDKAGQWNQWYTHAIPEADDLYDEHLAELKTQGLI